MPKDNSIKSVLIIGSGPIVIGQACEFDYAGSQSARSIREEGIEVIPVSYTHLDVYKRQQLAVFSWQKYFENKKVRYFCELFYFSIIITEY